MSHCVITNRLLLLLSLFVSSLAFISQCLGRAFALRIKLIQELYCEQPTISYILIRFLMLRFSLNKDQITYGLPTADVRGTILADQCPVEVDFPCQPRKFRAFNGYCNNVQNPKWGNSNTRYLR